MTTNIPFSLGSQIILKFILYRPGAPSYSLPIPLPLSYRFIQVVIPPINRHHCSLNEVLFLLKCASQSSR